MRVSIVSTLLAGGLLVLGGCATSTERGPLTLAERSAQCRGAQAATVPTGRQTGDARQDYRCRPGHGGIYRNTGANNAGSLNAAIDRSIRRGT